MAPAAAWRRPDLVAATEAAVEEGFTVALVEQPYRVAGRRSPAGGQAARRRLDRRASSTCAADELADLPLIVGGRSLGARVACRTVEATGAAAVLCLAFPLRAAAPGRQAAADPPARAGGGEAPGPRRPGRERPLRHAARGPRRQVVKVAGDHGLKADNEAVARAVAAWLASLPLGAAAGRQRA